MEPIKASDICSVCMDETHREFVYKTCCTLLLCRKCFNQLEVESFPNDTPCPGCRRVFPKICFNAVTINKTSTRKIAPCKKLVTEDETTHLENCVKCLQELIRGNTLFEQNIGEKHNKLKRKHDILQDEVFVRNQRIRELSNEVTARGALIRELYQKNAALAERVNNLEVAAVVTVQESKAQDVSQERRLLTQQRVSDIVNHLRSRIDNETQNAVSETDLLSLDSDETDQEPSPRTEPRESVLSWGDASTDSSDSPVSPPVFRQPRRRLISQAPFVIRRQQPVGQVSTQSRRSLRLALIASEIQNGANVSDATTNQ